MPETKITTVRLPAEVAEELAAIAEVKGVSFNDEVRRAVEARVAQAKADPKFQSALKRALKTHAELLGRLANT